MVDNRGGLKRQNRLVRSKVVSPIANYSNDHLLGNLIQASTILKINLLGGPSKVEFLPTVPTIVYELQRSDPKNHDYTKNRREAS